MCRIPSSSQEIYYSVWMRTFLYHVSLINIKKKHFITKKSIPILCIQILEAKLINIIWIKELSYYIEKENVSYISQALVS